MNAEIFQAPDDSTESIKVTEEQANIEQLDIDMDNPSTVERVRSSIASDPDAATIIAKNLLTTLQVAVYKIYLLLSLNVPS